jgi:uncharacterized protein involved in exopolysaccharide biosynthesis/Mrp family chromosome partitioning ATPase
VAAFAFFRLNPTPYQSEAKLFVRYVLSDKVIGPSANDNSAKSPDQRGETIMNSELEILTSVDLVRQVTDAVGAERILAKVGGGKDVGQAMGVVRSNLSAMVPPSSSVIHIAFKHPDPEVVQLVLREVVDRYLKLHVETHTANGMLGDFLTQETDQLRSRLTQTEEELRRATNKAGVISVTDAKKAYADQMTSIRRDLYTAEAELAQRASALEEISHRLPAGRASATEDAPIPPEILNEYRSVSNQWELLQKMEQELLTQFTPESPRVAEIHAQFTAADERRTKLQSKYPRLAQLGTGDHGASSEAANAAALSTQISALKARITVLTKQMNETQAEAQKVEQAEGTIVELQRKKELEEANYRYYAATLEQARINETLGNGRVSNIIQIQKPSPPASERAKTNKVMALIVGGGLALGLAWAFLIELYFDRSLKRAIDVERAVAAPLFLSIPAVERKKLSAPGANGYGPEALAADERPLIEYHETLRDRLIGYFESVNLNHKPKLVAVTGLGHGSGVTTTAAGLARSLSETGEGNVLLVDMNIDHGATQQFTNGRAVCGLDEILHARGTAHVDQNLYIVAENSQSDRLSRNMPQRFTKLVPKLKASDFDYIIFDMPPVSQVSITPRLAGFMDMVLLVVESERNDRDGVQRATRMLADTRAHVGLVLNKTRRYVPIRLQPASLAA